MALPGAAILDPVADRAGRQATGTLTGIADRMKPGGRMALSALIGTLGAALGLSAALAGEVEQIRLEAVVPARCGIEIMHHNVVLDLAAGFDQVRVATIAESCNSASGYTLKFDSASDGALVRGGDAVPYTARYGGKAMALREPVVLGRQGPAFAVRRDFAVSAPGSYGLPSGSYRDVITVTIAAR